jgi:hypothetical protein
MALEFAPAPIRDPIAQQEAESQRLMLTRVWIDWFASLGIRVDQQTHTLNIMEEFNLSGAVAPTPIPTDSLSEGLYRVTYYLRITVPASTSSAIQVAIGWTDGAVSCSIEAEELTTNTVGTVQSNTLMIRCDQAAPITFAVEYTSVGGTPMQYNLFIMVEQVAGNN